ncbi:hypothetical protein PVAND_009522 [Polypedilum vanderplanki]|uniref:Arrestin C-terminal-like domain-containing protein n=1 Tax=Polypedilum vanderplanki TaxID=319348 RepID=A0A9J6CD09_POLVA|nr:hypothetical protein PVAND_009522 [Polypedilum vanderplanki]
MVVHCEIKFDNNPNGIYFAGQTLSGVVEMTVDKPKKIRGLILKIEGYAKVEWQETQTYTDHHNNNNQTRTRTITYSGREDYISSTSYLIGSPQGNEIDLSPGQYRYNFQSLLPAQIPTSCETNNGYIRYLVTVILDRPFKFDLTYKVAFTVIKQLDLNYENPTLAIPLKMEFSKTFCCWCCKSKPIFIAASIERGGFVPGQIINVSVDINNESNYDFEDVKVSLKKIIRYNSQVPTLKSMEEILTEAEIRHGQIKKYSKHNFIQQLTIPPVPPTNLNYCRVLNVTYEVHVKCKGPTFSVDPFVKLPITIGTIPFHNQQYPSMPYASAPVLTPNSVNYDAMIGSFNNTPNPNSNGDIAPPPSYFDAVYTEANGNAVNLTESGEHSMGEKPFLPLYPVYSFNSTTNTLTNGEGSSNQNGQPSDIGFIQKY